MPLDALPFRRSELKASLRQDSEYELTLEIVADKVDELMSFYRYHLEDLPEIAIDGFIFYLFFHAIRGSYSCYCPFRTWRNLPHALRFAGNAGLKELEDKLAKSWREIQDFAPEDLDAFDDGQLGDWNEEASDRLREIQFTRFSAIIDADTETAIDPNDINPETEISSKADEYVRQHFPILPVESDRYSETLMRELGARVTKAPFRT